MTPIEWLLPVEVLIVAVATMIVGTFTPPMRDHLPWGRALRDWARVRRGKRAAILLRTLEEAQPEAQPQVTDYRHANGVAPIAEVSPSWLERRRAARAAKLRMKWEDRTG